MDIIRIRAHFRSLYFRQHLPTITVRYDVSQYYTATNVALDADLFQNVINQVITSGVTKAGVTRCGN